MVLLKSIRSFHAQTFDLSWHAEQVESLLQLCHLRLGHHVSIVIEAGLRLGGHPKCKTPSILLWCGVWGPKVDLLF